MYNHQTEIVALRSQKGFLGAAAVKTDLEPVVCPTAELEHARLLVEREILDIDLATRFVNGRRLPLNQPAVVHGGFGRQRHLKVAVGTFSGGGGGCGGGEKINRIIILVMIF